MAKKAPPPYRTEARAYDPNKGNMIIGRAIFKMFVDWHPFPKEFNQGLTIYYFATAPQDCRYWMKVGSLGLNQSGMWMVEAKLWLKGKPAAKKKVHYLYNISFERINPEMIRVFSGCENRKYRNSY